MPIPLVRKLLAEFLGTMILVVVAVGVATESFGFKLFGGRLGLGITGSIAAGVVATALAFGRVLAALVYAIGPISGCHINPAVTLGFIGSGRMKLVEGVEYLVAQFAGGIVGAYLLYWMFTTSPLYNKSVQGLGTDGYGSKSLLHVSEGGAFLIEVVLTAIFVSVVLFATHKAAIQGAAGVAIGFALLMVASDERRNRSRARAISKSRLPLGSSLGAGSDFIENNGDPGLVS